MSDDIKEEALEEICIGHLFLANDSDPDFLKRYKVDGKIIGIPNCDLCTNDEKNKHCKWYSPVRLHIYNVLPKEEPEKKD
ncbi:MAG: hypothetical protein QME12_01710 [Nanoarchaeota archaeon]|nr:hypothetical protein [Nanoarchaeota archaeon]